MKKLKVGVIGCGRISVMHLIPAKESDYSELVACCDIKKDRADIAAKRFGIKAYYDYTEMFDHEKLDAVHICLPHYLHVPVSMYAMERGINVLSEKPMSISYADALKAVECAKKNDVKYGVIFQSRYNDASRLVKNAVESGKLGRIISASSVLTWSRSDDYYSDSDWKGTWDKEGGGVVIDQAIHSIDLVNWLIDDEVKSVDAHISNRAHKAVQVEDTAEGLVTYRNGVKYLFYCTNAYAVDEPITIKLVCERGKVVFNYDEATVKYGDGTVEHVFSNNKPTHPEAKDYWGDSHGRQIDNFYKACLNLEPLEISGEDALKTQKIICSIYDNSPKIGK